MEVCDDHEDDIDAGIVKKIHDHNIYKNAKDLTEQLRPVANAIDTCQSDKTSIADAADTWLSLAEHPALQAHKKSVDKRLNQALTAEHFTAYKLHPKYQGRRLNDKQLAIVNEFLEQRDPDNIATLIALDAQSAPFPPVYFTESAKSINPVVWWKGLKMYSVPSSFIDLAALLLASPASSASIERVFSSFGLIHTKVRNRLGNAKAAKLVFCYRMLRGKEELDY